MIKRILYSLVLVLSFFIYTISVDANSINRIDMDVYLDENGNASITEIWEASLSEGTEGYRPYIKLGNSTISNFSVSDDSGRAYEVLSTWNVGASFDNKAYKCGIHRITNGVELCWGISQYGNRTYTLKYNISNFVTQYTDTQGIYFNFLNLDQSVGDAKIKIHSNIPFSLDNARIWAFGNSGSINFEDGMIVLDSGDGLLSNQYMVALVRFESNLFNTSNISSNSFDDIYDSAFGTVKDPSYNNGNKSNSNQHEKRSIGEILVTIILVPIFIILNPAVWLIAFVALGKIKGRDWLWGSSKYSGDLDFGVVGTTLPPDDEINYWREIPCNKDLERAYWVCSKYSVVSEATLKQGIIGAILLKWIRDGYITVLRTEKGLLNLKDNNYAIDFTKMTGANNEIEQKLYNMLVSAAGVNRILEPREFSKWSKRNYSRVNTWFNMIISKEKEYLERAGLITNSTEEVAGMFGRMKTITVKNVSPQLHEDAIQMKGLKKFLLDFSLMPEKEHFEVHIWEEYLIFAQLLGIADKVEEQFSKVYPKFNQEISLDTEMTTVFVRYMAETCYEGVQAGIEMANSRSSYDHDYGGYDRDSGGGGSSYDSGGSSSGGSSGGGFR